MNNFANLAVNDEPAAQTGYIDYTWKTRGEKIPKQIHFDAPVKHSESPSV